MSLLAWLLETWAHDRVGRHLVRSDGNAYLSKYTLVDGASLGLGEWALYVHKFHSSDPDQELHNHPWRHAVSLILAGGYDEERRMPDDTVCRATFLPGRVNVIHANTFHRVELRAGPCWTLVWTGKRCQEWVFWDRHTGAVTPWREFVASRMHVQTPGVQSGHDPTKPAQTA